jgi:hypothetical protein
MCARYRVAAHELYRAAGMTRQAGARLVPELTPEACMHAVREYRRACSSHAAMLNPRYHPTADGAAKAIFTYTPAQAQQVRDEFNRQIEEPSGNR